MKKIIHLESVGWLVNAAAVRVNEIMTKALQPLGLSQGQFAILKLLAEGDNITQVDIGRVISMPSYTITRHLDVLEQRGLLMRLQDKNSRRSFRIQLTASGREMSPKLFAITETVNEEFLSLLNADDVEQLKFLLKKMLSC